MKLTDRMIEAVEQVIRLPLDRFHKQELQALLDHLEPTPEHVTVVRDRHQVTWQRSIDDPRVWVTVGRSRVATARWLMDRHGPVTWS